MARSFDAVIVGGGHNGLACAAYLARAGKKVLALERRHVLGGAAVSEELFPGFIYSVCSYVVSLLRPWIIRDLELSRFGLEMIPHTGDLGYELWIEAEHALFLWDALMEAGRIHGLLPMGLDALDVARVEAGFLLGGVDYTSARTAFIERQKSTPFELGFDWMVKLKRPDFVGKAALCSEKERGPARRFVGLEIHWDDFADIHEAFGLPPHLTPETCREGVPLYAGQRQVGYATSRTFSPLLKKYLALATLQSGHAEPGTELQIEVTCEYERKVARATVRELPFYNPERKKAKSPLAPAREGPV